VATDAENVAACILVAGYRGIESNTLNSRALTLLSPVTPDEVYMGDAGA
jgi:hypothetical protein